MEIIKLPAPGAATTKTATGRAPRATAYTAAGTASATTKIARCRLYRGTAGLLEMLLRLRINRL